MLQQVMTEPGKIEFHEVPVPEISDREVLIKIMKIGICGSDIHVYHGEHPFTSYPVTQGHLLVSGGSGERPQPGSGQVKPETEGDYPSPGEYAAITTRATAADIIWRGSEVIGFQFSGVASTIAK